MRWTGKLVGFMIGLMVLPPLGVFVGLVLGHLYDIGILQQWLSLPGQGGGQDYSAIAPGEAKVKEASVSELGQKTNTTYNAMTDAEKNAIASCFIS